MVLLQADNYTAGFLALYAHNHARLLLGAADASYVPQIWGRALNQGQVLQANTCCCCQLGASILCNGQLILAQKHRSETHICVQQLGWCQNILMPLLYRCHMWHVQI